MKDDKVGSATGIDLSTPTTLWRVIFPDGVAVLMDTEPADIFKPHATTYRATPQHSVTEQTKIKTWRERLPEGAGLSFDYAHVCAMKAEIADLRAALAIPASTAASEQQAGATARDIKELPDLMSDWWCAARGAPAQRVYENIVTTIDSHFRAAITNRATTADEPCDCCEDIRVAMAIHGDGPDATIAADQMTERKTQQIGIGGMTRTGYILQDDTGRACIVHQGAVRWLSNAELWNVVHPAADQQEQADELALPTKLREACSGATLKASKLFKKAADEIERLNAALGTAADQQGAAQAQTGDSVDTPEFRELVNSIWGCGRIDDDGEAEISALIAHIDAWATKKGDT